MATQISTRPDQDHSAEKMVQQLRELFADAPQLGNKVGS